MSRLQTLSSLVTHQFRADVASLSDLILYDWGWLFLVFITVRGCFRTGCHFSFPFEEEDAGPLPPAFCLIWTDVKPKRDIWLQSLRVSIGCNCVQLSPLRPLHAQRNQTRRWSTTAPPGQSSAQTRPNTLSTRAWAPSTRLSPPCLW